MCDSQNDRCYEREHGVDWATLVNTINETDIDVIDMLNNTNPDATEEFLVDKALPKPQNSYGNMDIKRVEQNTDTIISLQKELELSELPEKKRIMAALVLENNLKRNRFVHANYLYNHSEPDGRETAAGEHKRANTALYGEPDEDVFWSVLGEKLSAIPVGDLSKEDKIMYGELLEMLGPLREVKGGIFRPQKVTVDWFSYVVEQFYAGFLSHIPPGQQMFSIEEACTITNEIISSELEGDMTTDIDRDLNGWRAVVIPAGAVASTNCEKKTIKFPGRRSRGAYTREELKSIIIHELGVHALRSLPYESCEIKAFSQGLPGYESFEEGVAKAADQAVNYQYEDFGLLHYISIGLASLLGKNFREVYEIQLRIEHLTGGEPAGRCFDSVQRAFRGTGELPNHKDLVYYNGAAQVWKYIEEHLYDTELMERLFLSGKSSTIDKMHERMIYEAHVGGYINPPL